jgi:hypothetical protein
VPGPEGGGIVARQQQQQQQQQEGGGPPLTQLPPHVIDLLGQALHEQLHGEEGEIKQEEGGQIQWEREEEGGSKAAQESEGGLEDSEEERQRQRKLRKIEKSKQLAEEINSHPGRMQARYFSDHTISPPGPPLSNPERICTFFNTRNGCSKGDKCKFFHIKVSLFTVSSSITLYSSLCSPSIHPFDSVRSIVVNSCSCNKVISRAHVLPLSAISQEQVANTQP